MAAAHQALRELLSWPQLYAAEGAALGVRWPRGLLLHGPPGCGKTLLVRSVAEEVGAKLHLLSPAQVFGSYLGESERRLRAAFEAAARDAQQGHTALMFLDEVDALCPRRDASRPHESRRSRAGHSSNPASLRHGRLVVVAATNRPNSLDPALRRPGRLDREVVVSVPSPADRAAILALHTKGVRLAPGCDLATVAAACHGYSGADLAALVREAAMHALYGAAVQQGLLPPGSQEGAALQAEDFTAAMRRVGPSIVRGLVAEGPDTRWGDIGGLEAVKLRLRQAVEWPLRHAAAFARLGLKAPRGVLLYGPPGCSKTTLARAAACASGATLLPLSCAQLFSMYVGEGEGLLRDLFSRARQAAPALIMLDEVDAVGAKRGGEPGQAGGGESSARLLSTLLTEMDGMELATGVLVLGATNRPQAMDAALLRPGRFDSLLYVPPPDEAGRLQVLQVHTRCMPLGADVDLAAVAADTQLYTGGGFHCCMLMYAHVCSPLPPENRRKLKTWEENESTELGHARGAEAL
ncbi:P-loop containing nucleoside triphosphate hydrolase protein [Haematococcus lacustris]